MASEAEKTFHLFATYGEPNSSGNKISNKNFVKLCKDCGIIDGKAVTSADVDIAFSKVKDKNSRKINWYQFHTAIQELSLKKFKGQSPKDALENMFLLMKDQTPVASGTKPLDIGIVSRLTDPSKYTGSHKERFDESGKGKGKRGWDDTKENSGYVSGYKGAGTYDEKEK